MWFCVCDIGQNKLYVIYYGVSVLRCDRYRVVLRCDRNVNVQYAAVTMNGTV